MKQSEAISCIRAGELYRGGNMKRNIVRRPVAMLAMGILTSLLFLAGCASNVSRSKLSAEDVEARKTAIDLFVEGKAEEAKGNRDAAISLYFEAFQYNPESDDIAIGLSKAFISSGKILSAQLFAEKAVSINPSNVEGLRILQFLYQQEGDIPKAADCLEKLLKLKPDSDIGVVFRLAQYYFALDKDSKAREILLVHAKRPNLPRGDLAGIAGFLADNGLFDDAFAIYRSMVEADPTDVDSWVSMGSLYGETGQEKKALEVFTQALEKNPGNLSLLVSIGNYCMSGNNWDCAITYFERARSAGLNNAKVLSTLAALNFNAKRFPQAEALRDSVIGMGDDGPSFYFSMGKSMNYLERYGDAVEYYRKGFAKPIDKLQDDEKLNAYLGFVRALINSGQGEEALRIIREDAQKNIGDEEAVKDVEGMVYMEMKRYEDAISLYEWLVDSVPDNPRYIISLTQAYNAAGQYQKSEEKLLPLLRKEPANTRYLMQISIVYDSMKQFKKAEDALLKVIKLEPENAHALNNLAYMYIENGKSLSKAIEMVKRALKIDPKNGAFLDTLGWGFFRKGDLAAARENIEGALAIAEKADCGVIYDHYGDILVRQDQKDKAREAYQKAIEYGEDKDKIQKKIDALGR